MCSSCRFGLQKVVLLLSTSPALLQISGRKQRRSSAFESCCDVKMNTASELKPSHQQQSVFSPINLSYHVLLSTFLLRVLLLTSSPLFLLKRWISAYQLLQESAGTPLEVDRKEGRKWRSWRG